MTSTPPPLRTPPPPPPMSSPPIRPKSSNRIVWVILGFALLSFRMMIFAVEYVENAEQLEISYKDWATERPSGDWVNITEVKADMINAVYLESLISGNDKPDAFFIPLKSADSTFLDNEVKMLLRVEKGALYDQVLELMDYSELELMSHFLENQDAYLIDGPFDGYRFNADEIDHHFKNAIPNLADYVKVIDHEKRYPFGAIIFFGLIWLGLLIYIIRSFFAR